MSYTRLLWMKTADGVRGVKEEQCTFNDQHKLKSFLSLSEEGKQRFTPSTYSARSEKC